MEMNHKATLEELQWKDVRAELSEKNPDLAKIIDELSPSSEYTLFKASYPFGSEILKNGILNLPNKQGILVPLTDFQNSASVQNKLDYNFSSNPVSVILNNTSEIFMIFENNTIPLYGLISPGKIFGTWRILNSYMSHSPGFLWSMTAGARSIFMLPKISETAGHNKLRRAFHLHAEKPNSLFDHWKIFKEIANHPDFGENWNMEILFFPKKWFERLNDKKWRDFKIYLYEKAWEGSEFLRNQFIWDIVFSVI